MPAVLRDRGLTRVGAALQMLADVSESNIAANRHSAGSSSKTLSTETGTFFGAGAGLQGYRVVGFDDDPAATVYGRP